MSIVIDLIDDSDGESDSVIIDGNECSSKASKSGNNGNGSITSRWISKKQASDKNEIPLQPIFSTTAPRSTILSTEKNMQPPAAKTKEFPAYDSSDDEMHFKSIYENENILSDVNERQSNVAKSCQSNVKESQQHHSSQEIDLLTDESESSDGGNENVVIDLATLNDNVVVMSSTSEEDDSSDDESSVEILHVTRANPLSKPKTKRPVRDSRSEASDVIDLCDSDEEEERLIVARPRPAKFVSNFRRIPMQRERELSQVTLKKRAPSATKIGPNQSVQISPINSSKKIFAKSASGQRITDEASSGKVLMKPDSGISSAIEVKPVDIENPTEPRDKDTNKSIQQEQSNELRRKFDDKKEAQVECGGEKRTQNSDINVKNNKADGHTAKTIVESMEARKSEMESVIGQPNTAVSKPLHLSSSVGKSLREKDCILESPPSIMEAVRKKLFSQEARKTAKNQKNCKKKSADHCQTVGNSEECKTILENSAVNPILPTTQTSQKNKLNDKKRKKVGGETIGSDGSMSAQEAKKHTVSAPKLRNREICVEKSASLPLTNGRSNSKTDVIMESSQSVGLVISSDVADRVKRNRKRKKVNYNLFENDGLEKALECYDPRIAMEQEAKGTLHAKESSQKPTMTQVLPGDSNVIVMHEIPHLTKPTDTKLPNYRFTVFFPFTDWHLFDFEIKIKPSTVDENAGLGAFLIYHGGRRLDERLDKISQEKISGRRAIIPTTVEDLTGRFIDGSTAQITLKGKHLHGHNNSMFQAITEKPVKASIGKKKLSISLNGKNLHYDSDEEDHLDLSCCPKRIGNLGLFIESDYSHDKTMIFAPPTGQIAFLDIGRYGPVRKQDRKKKEDFDIKNFLFDNEPAGWCFQVDEEILGSEQWIDVTDDKTGEFHNDAKKFVAPYVNEVGYNLSLEQNVHTRQKGDNCVNYYFAVNRELHAGDEIEMLTDYDGPYEPTRERKGYGEKNLNGESQSDYNAKSKLQRNFLERNAAEEMIKSMSPRELFYSMEFIITRILPGVKEATESVFIVPGNGVQESYKGPSNRQLRARRRLHWIASVYIERSTELSGCGLEEGSKIGEKAVAEMMEKCREWAKQFCWDRLTLSPFLPRIKDENLREVFAEETVEEVLYYVRDALPKPFDLNLWCKLARDYTVLLCNIAYEQLRVLGHVDKVELASSFMCKASGLAGKIRDAIKDKDYAALFFTSGVEKGRNVVEGRKKNFVTLAAGPVLSNSFVVKGAVSALLDMEASRKADECHERIELSSMKRSCDDPVLIVKTRAGSSPSDGIPRRIDYVLNGHGEVNDTWYLVWQDIYVTYSLLKGLVDKFSTDCDGIDKFYEQFLLDLCKSVNIDISLVRNAIQGGFCRDLPLPAINFEPEYTNNAGCGKIAKKNVKNCRKAGKSCGPRKRKSTPAASLTGRKRKKLVGQDKRKSPEGKINKGVKQAKRPGQFFYTVVWEKLVQCGWRLERGNREKDYYFLPPGISRGQGFKNRVDFFDSNSQVLNFLKSNEKWKEKPEIIECLRLLEKCSDLKKEKMLKTKTLDEIVEFAREKLRKAA